MSDDRVVLPAPDGPTSATTVPGSAENETPRRTGSDGSSRRSRVPSPSSDSIDTVAGDG